MTKSGKSALGGLIVASLPYDIARCKGALYSAICSDCRRREPGRVEHQAYMTTPFEAMTHGYCPNYIKPVVLDSKD